MCKFFVWVGTTNLCHGKRRLAFSDDWEKVPFGHQPVRIESPVSSTREGVWQLPPCACDTARFADHLVSFPAGIQRVFPFFSPTYGAAFISGSWRRRVFHASSCCGEMSSSVLDLEGTERERTRGAARPSCPRGDTNRAAGLSGKWSGKGATCVRTVPRTCPICE